MPLDPRPEGVYVNPCVYPAEGLLGSTSLTRIERVNGDCTVTSIILTPIEAVHVMDGIRRLMTDAGR